DFITINIGEKDLEIENLLEDYDYNWYSDNRTVSIHNIRKEIEKINFDINCLPKRDFPDNYSNFALKEKASFLQGCFSANGGVIKDTRISYRTTNNTFAKQLSKTLIKDFNIDNYITTNKSTKIKWHNGEYVTKESYDVNISRYKEIQKFHKKINFYHTYKQLQLENLLKNRAPKVTSIKNNGIQKVYDFTEPKTHWGVIERFICHNCGEQPLLPWESCTLGAIHLGKMLKKTNNGYKINWEKLDNTVRLATRFLDNVIDANEYPLPELEKAAKKNRKIGVGVMGWHEMLIKLNIKYDSQKALDLARYISKIINETSISESQELAKEKGVFPNFNNSNIEKPRRNAVTTTVAPTGSRSIIANTTSGIEPLYSIDAYTHTDAEGNITEFEFDFLKEANEKVLVDAHSISPRWHIKMQAAWQENVGSAVSKTINMPKDTPKETVETVYKMAYELNCKGITIYRDGSKIEQVLNNDEEKFNSNNKKRGQVIDAENEANSKRFKLKTGCGTMYLIVVFDDDGNVIETFTETKNGGCKASTEALSRMNSLSLRGGVPLKEVVDQLLSVSPCVSYMTAKAKGKEVSKGTSCPHAVALKLKKFIDNPQNINIKEKAETKEETISDDNKCPECGNELTHESGCQTCYECGWSKCG
ncbi:MAG: LAGLIDADG family homing endonuclease, partial [Candidatus Woesearchaeota archaeon]